MSAQEPAVVTVTRRKRQWLSVYRVNCTECGRVATRATESAAQTAAAGHCREHVRRAVR